MRHGVIALTLVGLVGAARADVLRYSAHGVTFNYSSDLTSRTLQGKSGKWSMMLNGPESFLSAVIVQQTDRSVEDVRSEVAASCLDAFRGAGFHEAAEPESTRGDFKFGARRGIKIRIDTLGAEY